MHGQPHIRLYNVSTLSCVLLTIILSSSSIYLCHSSLRPLIPFPPINHLIPSAQVSLGLPRFLLPGWRHSINSFGNLPSSILWTCPYHWSCLVLISSKRDLITCIFLFNNNNQWLRINDDVVIKRTAATNVTDSDSSRICLYEVRCTRGNKA